MAATHRRIPFAAVDPTNRNTALASALVEELARCGVRHAVVSPGSRSTPLALALWRQPAIEVAVIVDERSAGFFALGAAQASGAAGGRPLHLRHRGGQPPPRRLRGRRGRRPADRAHRRPPAGAARASAPARRSTSSSSTGTPVRWFCEVGTHEADDGGLLHYRSVACRAYAAARGEPRPGPVHLNLAWREPLAPEPHPEGRHRDLDRSRCEGRGERPLTAVPGPEAPQPSEALVDEMAGHMRRRRPAGPDRRRPPARPRARRAARRARRARAATRSSPSRPRSCAAGRTTARWSSSHYDAIAARCARTALEPELVLRFGDMPTSKPLRAVARGLAGAPARSSSIPASAGTSRRAGRRRSCAPIRRGLASATGRRGSPMATDAEWPRRWRRRRATRRRAAIADASSRRLDGPDRARPPRGARADSTATAISSTPPRACRSATRRRSSPATPTRCQVPLQPRRQRDRRPGLLGHRRRQRQRPPDVDRHRRPRPLPRHRRPGRAARRRARRSGSS